MSKRLVWAIVAGVVLLLMLAPLASYCLGREEDYRDKGELKAPAVPDIGPRVIYGKGQELIVYDLGGGRRLWSKLFVVSARPFAGRLLLVMRDSVRLVDIDGTDRGELFRTTDPSLPLSGVAGSPDGNTVAVTQGRLASCQPGAPSTPSCDFVARVTFIDTASGQASRTDFTRAMVMELRGLPAFPVWRSDSRGVVVYGASPTENPGGVATVFRDGRTVAHKTSGHADVAPNGLVAAHGELIAAQCLVWATHRIALRDLDAGRELAAVEDRTLAMIGRGWSPDGSEYLVETRKWSLGDEDWGTCRFWQKPGDWLLLNARTGAVSHVADPRAVLKRWFRPATAELRDCPYGETSVTRFQTETLLCATVQGHSPSGRLYIGSRHVDEGPRFTIYGRVD